MLTNFSGDKWVEYQVEVVQPSTQLCLRYVGITGSKLTISVDGTKQSEHQLPWTDSKWDTIELGLSLTQGRHRIRLQVSGNISMNWMIIR